MSEGCILQELDYGIGETTLRGYSEPFRDLNIERLPFSPLRGLTVVKRNDVLNGLSRAFAHASPLTLPKPIVQLLQKATFALTQVLAYWGEVSMRTRTAGGRPFAEQTKKRWRLPSIQTHKGLCGN